MSLRPCKECGTPISTQAKNCPRCGAKNNNINKFVAYIVILGILITVITAIISGLNPSNTATKKVDNIDALIAAHSFVKDKLKAPATAEFPTLSKTAISRTGIIWELSSYVDAQNSYGAMIRSDWYVKIRYDSTTDMWHLEDININNK